MTRATPKWVLLSAIALVAANLRPVITSVPPVALRIQEGLGLGEVALGLLTTLPVFCMGLFAIAVPAIAGRVGRQRTVWLALAVLTVAMASRLAGSVPGVLQVSAVVGGVGIALAAGLVPGIVREQLPHDVGSATGSWSAAMFTGAAVGAAVTVPLASLLGSWEEALAFWAVPAALAWLVWTIVERPYRPLHETARVHVPIRQLPWRDRHAWALTTYLTLNSVVFYSAIAWIAPSLEERGWSAASSGWLFGIFAAAQIVGGLLMPRLSHRATRQRAFFIVLICIDIPVLLVLGFTPGFLTPVTLFVFGMAHSGAFAVGLSMLSSLAADPAASARLTAMAFFITYVVAAFGPTLSGAVLALTDSWAAVYVVLAIIAIFQIPSVLPLRRGVVIA